MFIGKESSVLHRTLSLFNPLFYSAVIVVVDRLDLVTKFLNYDSRSILSCLLQIRLIQRTVGHAGTFIGRDGSFNKSWSCIRFYCSA